MSIPTSKEEIERLRLIGMHPLTFPYVLPMEEEEFERAKAQLAGEPYALVWYDDTEVEIWTVHTPLEPDDMEDGFIPAMR